MASDTHDDVMRRFLLDTVTAEEREFVENQIADSQQFADELTAIEEELIVMHLKGTLPDQWREAFRAAFLSHQEGRDRIQEVAAFRDLIAGAAPAPSAAGRFGATQAAALAAAVALAVTGVVFYQSRNRAPVPGDGDPAPASIAEFTLPPGPTRSETPAANIFRIPPDAQVVRLRLTLEGPDDATLQTTLRPVGGTAIPIASSPQVRGEGGVVQIAWDIPAASLPAGDYLLTVTAAERGTIGSRFFTVAP